MARDNGGGWERLVGRSRWPRVRRVGFYSISFFKAWQVRKAALNAVFPM